jgi:hypothetical protein
MDSPASSGVTSSFGGSRTMTDIPPDLRVCAVCGRVLDRVDGSGYLHFADAIAGGADHPVVPVLPGAVHVNGSCDFCYGPAPTFLVPVRDFVFEGAPQVRTPDGVVRETGSQGNWSACRDCATLIERNDWNGIFRRAIASHPAAGGAPEVRSALRRMFRQVRSNITGAVRPFTFPRPGDPGQ